MILNNLIPSAKCKFKSCSPTLRYMHFLNVLKHTHIGPNPAVLTLYLLYSTVIVSTWLEVMKLMSIGYFL